MITGRGVSSLGLLTWVCFVVLLDLWFLGGFVHFGGFWAFLRFLAFMRVLWMGPWYKVGCARMLGW